MDFKNIHSVYFLGIGGIGMSALARYFKAMGKEVYGYDKTSTQLTDELIAEGIHVHFEEDAKYVQSLINNQQLTINNSLIVYTPAVPKSHSEYVLFSDKLGFKIKKRAEVLGMITENSLTVAVAGTHGKTTTSSMIAHILKTAGIDCSAFLGGITQNYKTNLLLAKQPITDLFTEALAKGGNRQPITVVEADEYDRSFLTLHPDVAVITSLDADHLDIYGDKKYMEESYSLFSNQVKTNGKLIVKKEITGLKSRNKAIYYSIKAETDYYAKNILIENGEYNYDVVASSEVIKKIILGIPGLHNVENSVAAIAAVKQLNVSNENIKKALGSFKGVKRRFDYQIKTKEIVFIDDYAHHPEELRACISSVREMYTGKKITGIFQPHLYSRTRDFADEFAKSLDLLDETILLDIYPARELPIEGITSSMLLAKMSSKNKSLCSKKELVNDISKRKIEVLLTLGAGDIDTLVAPLKKELMKRCSPHEA